MRRLTAIAVLLCAGACDRTLADARPQAAPTLARSALPASAYKVAAAAPQGAGEEPPLSAADALRLEDWKAAARELDALGPELLEKPELCYARARVALELSEHERVLELLTDLESKLPKLGDRIRRLRAAAALEVGPYEEAAKYFLAQGDPASLLSAGTALRRAGKLKEARAALDRALATAKGKKYKKLLPLLHAERAALFEQQGEKQRAASELRWLLIEVPLSPVLRDADERLAKLAPKRALTKAERAARLDTFVRAGEIEAVDRELEKLAATPGPALGRGKVAFARGYALYASRTDYARASELLSEAARKGAPDPAKASFYAARALARAHQDDKAIEGYRALARKYPRTMWSQYATYLVAKTYYSIGRFDEAIKGYDHYLSRYGKKGSYLKDVAEDRPIALLAAGRHAEAASAIEKLRGRATSNRERARWLELEGAARASAGDKPRAVELLKEAISEQPLSFAALAAVARLEQLGEPVPPLLGAPPAASKVAPLVVELPQPVALLNELGLDGEAEAEFRTLERLIEGAHQSRGLEALCRAYGKLDVAARRYQIAQSSVDGKALRAAPSPATLWQWECIYPRPHELLVRRASADLGMPEVYLWSIMRQESGFRPDVVSPADAVGLMQLIPPTAKRVAEELNVPYEHESLRSPAYNVKLGSYYLKKLLDLFDGNFALAAAGYNAGPSAVFRWLESSSSLPLDVFVARIPYDETRGYVERVLGNQARYRYVDGGENGVPKLSLDLPKGLKPTSDLY